MTHRTTRGLMLWLLLAIGLGCGGEPEAEATWETHTTVESAGSEAPASDSE